MVKGVVKCSSNCSNPELSGTGEKDIFTLGPGTWNISAPLLGLLPPISEGDFDDGGYYIFVSDDAWAKVRLPTSAVITVVSGQGAVVDKLIAEQLGAVALFKWNGNKFIHSNGDGFSWSQIEDGNGVDTTVPIPIASTGVQITGA